jgi:transposase-like protein
MYVKLNGEMVYLWRAVDHEGEILESYVTKKRDKSAALAFMKKALKRHGWPEIIVTDGLRSYPAAMRELGNLDRCEMERWKNNWVENSHLSFRRTRAGNAAIPATEDAPEIRFGPCQPAQSFQSGTPPRRPSNLPRTPFGRSGRMAVACGLTISVLAQVAPNGDKLRLD